MSNKVFFISTNYLKSNTAINANVADELLNNSIFEAQSIHIQQLIGTDLYNKLVNLIKTNTIGDPQFADYKYLLDNYIVDCTAYWAWVECIPYLVAKVVNKGVERQNSEWSSPAAINEVEYLRDDLRNKAQFYSQRLTDYLLQHRNLYPEFSQNHEIDKLRPQNGNYFSGIVFDDGSCPCERTMGYPHNAINIL